MSEDITFCAVDCDVLGCERNHKHIRVDAQHSYADFSADEDRCLKLMKPEQIQVKAGFSEIVYSDEYEDYICKVCGEILMGTCNVRFCPYCGRPFMPRKAVKRDA